jgi:hypothetical protein
VAVTKPRFGAQVDGTQPDIVDVLREVGAHVLVLDVSEAGEPDLLVAWMGVLNLLECKARKGGLSPEQVQVHDEYARCGIRVHTVRSLREALDAIGLAPEAIARRLQAWRELVPRQKLARLKLQSSVKRPA